MADLGCLLLLLISQCRELVDEALVLPRLAHQPGHGLLANSKLLGYLLLVLQAHHHLVDDQDLVADWYLGDTLLPLPLARRGQLLEVWLADGSG